SVVVVLPASMWAMTPRLRTLSSATAAVAAAALAAMMNSGANHRGTEGTEQDTERSKGEKPGRTANDPGLSPARTHHSGGSSSIAASAFPVFLLWLSLRPLCLCG